MASQTGNMTFQLRHQGVDGDVTSSVGAASGPREGAWSGTGSVMAWRLPQPEPEPRVDLHAPVGRQAGDGGLGGAPLALLDRLALALGDNLDSAGIHTLVHQVFFTVSARRPELQVVGSRAQVDPRGP